MFRTNAAPPAPDPLEAARKAVKTCAQVQLGIACTHLVTFALLGSRLVFYKPRPPLHVSAALLHQLRVGGLWFGIAYVALFAGWAALNAWGLGRKSKVAHWSSIAFAGATIATCCAAPIGGVLLYVLLRRDMKSYFT